MKNSKSRISDEKHVAVGAVVVDEEGGAVFVLVFPAAKSLRLANFKENPIICVSSIISWPAIFRFLCGICKNRVYLMVIVKGLKFPRTYMRKLDITIRNSLEFLPMSLKSMPRAFGSPAQKGLFPSLFAKKADLVYERLILEKQYLCPKTLNRRIMKISALERSKKFSQEIAEYLLELLRYCKNNCQIFSLDCPQFL